MKKYLEVIGAVAFVLGGTYIVYNNLAGVASFWDAQKFWSLVLCLCWLFVSAGYFHQGAKVRELRRADEVSLALPITVFVVQCILFVKGVYYKDWSLMFGAVVVNTGVSFSLWQIFKFKLKGK